MVARNVFFSMAAPNHDIQPRVGHCEFFQFYEDELDTSDLHVRFIHPVTTQRLLSSHPPHQSFHHSSTSLAANNINTDVHNGESLLSVLARLAPSVAKDFVSKASNYQALQFRLIHDVHDLPGQERSYIAMSYARRKTNQQTPQKIVSPLGDLPFGWVRTVEQFPLPTSRGLFMGVLNEREEGEGLWFDQVCIDQEDEAEKAVTIGAMDSIYRNARMVVVALGDIAATVDELVFLQRYVREYDILSDCAPHQQPNQGLYPPFMEQNLLFASFVERVLDSAWFASAWCHHEMRMGRDHVFLVSCPAAAAAAAADEFRARGYEVCTVIRFTGTFLAHMLFLAGEVTSLGPSRQIQIRSLLRVFDGTSPQSKDSNGFDLTQDYAKTYSSNTAAPSESPSLVSTATQVFQLRAGGNPRLPEYLRRLDANRDKMSIALNISSIPLALTPSLPFQRPTIEDECLRKLLLVGLASRDPLALCTTGPPLQLHDGSVSWLSRLSYFDGPPSLSASQATARLDEHDVQTITQGSDGRAEYIQLDFIFLDLPHRSRPNTDFTSHVQRAREIIDICVRHGVQSRNALWSIIVPSTHHAAQHQQHQARTPALRNIFIQTLACAFECGLPWLLDIAITQQQHPSRSPSNTPPTPLLLQNNLSPLFTPSLPLTHYITHNHPSHILTTFSHLMHILANIITAGIPWASGATEATHGPLIVELPSPSPPPPPAPILSPSTSSPSSQIPFPSPSPASASSSSIPTQTPFPSPPTTATTSSTFSSSSLSSSSTSTHHHHHHHQHQPHPAKKALLFAPFAHSKTLLIAVPKPLSPPAFSALPRAWVLTPKSSFTGAAPTTALAGSSGAAGAAGEAGDGVVVVRWVLRGKSVLFGERGFVGGLGREEEGGGGAGAGAEAAGVGVERRRRRVHWVYGPGMDGL